MIKQFIIFLFLFFMLGNVFSANVMVNVDIYSDHTVFNYEFIFDENESYRSFSFEKPMDATVDLVSSLDPSELVKYSIAGDYLIINPKSIKNKTFKIQFKSVSISNNIYDKNSFELYSNFNFVVDKLIFNIEMVENVGDIETFFPRDYRILDDGSFEWTLTNIDKEELFRLEFSKVHSKEEIKNGKFWTDNLLIIVSGIVLFSALVILVLMFLFSTKFRLFNIKISFNNKNKPIESKVIQKTVKVPIVSVESVDSKDNTHNSNDKISTDEIEFLTGANNDLVIDSKFDEEEYREVIAKFLTENEKLVVSCVRENEGISQYDILNFLPKLTKSNLSKIISKLDNKHILKRIRVGKVNKIYLGNRFEIKKEDTLG
jgi:uncharacterized membrane protein